jgi:hypothetical protein
VLRPGAEHGRPLALVTEIPRIPAAEVASQVVDGRPRSFWVITHPDYLQQVDRRAGASRRARPSSEADPVTPRERIVIARRRLFVREARRGALQSC